MIEGFWGQRAAILIQHTNESLIEEFVEEFRGSKGNDFDTAHEQKC